jgi:hypothetical protein
MPAAPVHSGMSRAVAAPAEPEQRRSVTALQDWLTVPAVDLKTVETLRARVCELLGLRRRPPGPAEQAPRILERGIERC